MLYLVFASAPERILASAAVHRSAGNRTSIYRKAAVKLHHFRGRLAVKQGKQSFIFIKLLKRDAKQSKISLSKAVKNSKSPLQ